MVTRNMLYEVEKYLGDLTHHYFLHARYIYMYKGSLISDSKALLGYPEYLFAQNMHYC